MEFFEPVTLALGYLAIVARLKKTTVKNEAIVLAMEKKQISLLFYNIFNIENISISRDSMRNILANIASNVTKIERQEI